MKVLHIINSLTTGGAEKLILESLPLYKKSGVDVELLLFKTNNYPFEKQFLSTSEVVVHKSRFNSFYSPLNIFYIIPFLKKYDLIHVHLFPAMYWVALAKVLSFSKTELVFTEHNTTNRRLDKWYFNVIDKFIYSKYNKIISISEKVNEMLIDKMKIEESKVHLIKNGINLDSINKALPISKNEIHKEINEEHKILIQISRFQPQKDQQTLIKAMQFLPETVILCLVGDGELKLECEQLSKQLNLEERVFFLGVRLDVFQLLKTADIVVLSSHYEGLSLASIEGLASGKPFIASNVPGLTEVVKNGGLLFEESNEIELAEIINKLLADNKYYKQVAASCFDKSKEYDINIMLDRQIQLYKNILAK